MPCWSYIYNQTTLVLGSTGYNTNIFNKVALHNTNPWSSRPWYLDICLHSIVLPWSRHPLHCLPLKMLHLMLSLPNATLSLSEILPVWRSAAGKTTYIYTLQDNIEKNRTKNVLCLKRCAKYHQNILLYCFKLYTYSNTIFRNGNKCVHRVAKLWTMALIDSVNSEGSAACQVICHWIHTQYSHFCCLKPMNLRECWLVICTQTTYTCVYVCKSYLHDRIVCTWENACK